MGTWDSRSCHQRPSCVDRICFLAGWGKWRSLFCEGRYQFWLFKIVPNRVKGLGLHSEDTEEALQSSFTGQWHGLISVSAGWRLDGRTACQSGCWRGLRRLLQESSKRWQSSMGSQRREWLKGCLPSLFPPFLCLEGDKSPEQLNNKERGWGGGVRGAGGGGDARSVAGKQERKAVCLVVEEVDFCDLTTLGPRSTSWGQS